MKKQPALWSLKRPGLPDAPAVHGQQWIRNDIDRFILSKLEAKNLAPSPEADKRTLIRRATYDLTGLPPSAEEIDRFVRDTSANAYEKLIDRLLASPRYGERWGRHWLDVARYADSVNDSVNSGQRFPWSYTYRDWVIRSLNEDLPYDRFVLYQLAADRVPASNHVTWLHSASSAWGGNFRRAIPRQWTTASMRLPAGFLGLTVACARCHDHKFDPIPTKDYYSFYSILSNIREPDQLPLLGKTGGLSPKQEMYRNRLERIQKEYQEYRVRRNSEMVAFFKTQTADYLVAAHDTETLTNTGIEDLVRDRQLNQHVLAALAKVSARIEGVRRAGVPVMACRGGDSIRRVCGQVARRTRRGQRRPACWKRS